jgi:hypothetical protein
MCFVIVTQSWLHSHIKNKPHFSRYNKHTIKEKGLQFHTFIIPTKLSQEIEPTYDLQGPNLIGSKEDHFLDCQEP